MEGLPCAFALPRGSWPARAHPPPVAHIHLPRTPPARFGCPAPPLARSCIPTSPPTRERRALSGSEREDVPSCFGGRGCVTVLGEGECKGERETGGGREWRLSSSSQLGRSEHAVLGYVTARRGKCMRGVTVRLRFSSRYIYSALDIGVKTTVGWTRTLETGLID